MTNLVLENNSNQFWVWIWVVPASMFIKHLEFCKTAVTMIVLEYF